MNTQPAGGDVSEPRTGDAVDLFNPNADRCLNCGRPRSDHRFTRGGAVCLNGRRFKADEKAIRAAMTREFGGAA